MEEIIHTVREFVVATYLPGESPQALGAAMPLRTSGILDSLATLDLVTFLEERYGIELEADDLGPGRLETLQDIADLVQSKLGGSRD